MTINKDQIKEHMEVVGSCGHHVGTVDHVDGEAIKLTKSDSTDGKHKMMSLSQVAKVEGGKVWANKNHKATIAKLRDAA